ncbi:MAG: hypothetical protein PVG39_02475 [Desulfobacteraceae bacterium]
MGLDMYLEKEIYVGAEYRHRNITGSVEIFQNDEPIKVDFNKINTITEKVGYWRKANHIHQWFVDNVQEGIDNCGRYYVSFGELKTLRAICKDIMTHCLLHKGMVNNGFRYTPEGKEAILEKGYYMDYQSYASSRLPVQSGFFFGGTNYDQWYYQDLEETVSIIDSLDPEGDYYYCASW